MYLGNKNQIFKTRPNGFLILYLVFCLLMAVNFFVTENPYAARHSGGTARWAEAHSETWALHVGLLLITAAIVALLATVRKLPYKPMLKIFCIFLWLLISGFYTGALWKYPSSYFFIGLTFILVSLLAINDNRQSRIFEGKKLFYFIVFSYTVGVLLSFIKPGVYGWITFGFSRLIRGEVTVSEIFALPLILTISFITFDSVRKIKYFLIILVLSIIEISFFTRKTQWMLIFPFVVFFVLLLFEGVLKKKVRSKLIVWVVVLGYFASFFPAIYFYILHFDPYELEAFLNGRMPLWQWHYQLFLENPLFGSGIFPEQPAFYTGSADSEIGLLAAFSQFGLPFGLFQIVIVAVAIKKGVFILIITQSREIEKFFSYIIMTMFPLWMLQNSWRILNAYDLLFWYGCFYLFFMNKRSLDLLPFSAKESLQSQ